MITDIQASIEDLYHVTGECKAEIVDGNIVLMSPTGDMPARAGGAIYMSLRLNEHNWGGRAYPDNVGFKVDLPNRKSFSPNAAFFIGKSSGMKFLDGTPVFAAEIRSENDYGDKAEARIKEKIKDYFAAGTLVVWDVDLIGEDTIKVYRSTDPSSPTIYKRGEIAEADPALPGWKMPVNALFE
jgi:Uma2 family endonuclease